MKYDNENIASTLATFGDGGLSLCSALVELCLFSGGRGDG
jgi:hypothetical protein